MQPDILPCGSVKISAVWIDGHAWSDFDAEALTVRLPEGHGDIKVRVRISPTSVRFSADVLSVEGGLATMALAGAMTPHDLKYLDEAMNEAFERGAKALEIDAADLAEICTEGLRYLAFRKQKAGADFRIAVRNASAAVARAIRESAFDEEIVLAESALA